MAKSFNVELAVREGPEQAQAGAASALRDAARAVGLRLAGQSAGELTYRPRYQFPFVVMLWHVLNGERMTVSFAAGPEGGTVVYISGAVARGNHELASDPEHWSEALGGSPAS